MEIRPSDVSLRDLATGDIGWLVQMHAEYYASNDGFDDTFELLVADILVDFARNRDPKKERAWIATANGQRLGSIFCARSDDPDIAKLRLFFLVPESRGLGLGQILISSCIDFARAQGYRALHLWTHESHEAACALYAKNGFVCTDSKPVRSFSQDLVEQTWQLDLT